VQHLLPGQYLLDRVPTLDFLALRFAVASVSMLRVAPKAIARLPRESRRHAVVLGGLYDVAQILQTAGLAHTPASVSGFVTAPYVVATPLFAAVTLRTRITRLTAPARWVESPEDRLDASSGRHLRHTAIVRLQRDRICRDPSGRCAARGSPSGG
jgi:hypothetical protein